MEENTTVLEGQENAEGTPDVFDEGFDSDWGEPVFDDGQGGEDPVAVDFDEMPESEGTEADADQQEADGDEGGEADGDSTEAEAEGETESEPDRAEAFTLKHLGEERSVGRDEVVVLAQKGMDYDRIRGQRDKYQAAWDFLGELAEARGGDGELEDRIYSLMDETRARTMMARAEAKGEELAPAEAATRAINQRLKYKPADAEEAKYAVTEEQRAEKGQQEITRFLKEYPDVKAEEIPKEVWDDVNRNDGDLLGAYQRYENRLLKDELKKLKEDYAAAQQQKKNKERSTGSTKSVGSSKAKDPFEEGWDAS